MLEKDIEKRLAAEIKALGGIAYKWESPGNAGVPDRICILPRGSCIFVETKQPKGTLKKRQALQHKRLLQRGHRVVKIYTMDELNDFLKSVKKDLQNEI